MNAVDVAHSLGIDKEAAEHYMRTCADVIESPQYVATLKGNTVHIAAEVVGLGGRKLLRDCRATLSRWFQQEPELYAPVKHGNARAVRLAEALGFHQYAATDTHVWLMQTRERFNGH